MKKILLLGGSQQQIIAIETAKKLGYYTVLCDYLNDNPGQYVADKFYLESTTDKDKILEIAKQEEIDGILAYASDPAAPTAAYVAEKMGLPGNPFKSVEILCNKDLYRKFLKENGFNTPKAKGYENLSEANNDILNGFYNFPVIVKPVDSSGSKGINLIDDVDKIEDKLEYAMSFSKIKRIIIEEYIEKQGYQIAGDGLSIDGKFVFDCFGDDHFNSSNINPFVPVSASFPCTTSNEMLDKVRYEIQRLISLLDIKTCTFNFDIRVDKNGNVFLMEIAPRSGGNYIPQIVKYSTDVDLVECSIKAAMGDRIIYNYSKQKGYYAYYALNASKEGILNNINIKDDVIKNNILNNYIVAKKGDRISKFVSSNKTLGCLIMKFDSKEQMLEMIENPGKWIKIEIASSNE